MWRWLLLALGLLVLLGGLNWLIGWLRSAPPEYVGVYVWDPGDPSTHAHLAMQRKAWARMQGTLTERDLLAGEALQIEPGPPRETLMVLLLLDNGEAGMRPAPPHSLDHATGRWVLAEGEVVVTMTRASGTDMPQPYVLRGRLRDERLRMTVTSDGVTEKQVFLKTAPTSDCSCDAGHAGETTWCWRHDGGFVSGVETSCWHCTFSAERGVPCAACREILEDKGRRALLDGRTEEAQVYLARAYTLGASDPTLRFLLAQAQADPLLVTYEVSTKALPAREPTWFGHGVLVLQLQPGRLVFLDALRGDGAAEHRFEGEAPLVAISPAGTQVAVLAGSSVRVMDVRSEHPVRTIALALDEENVVALAWSPSGDALAAASESGAIRVWSAVGKPLHTISADQHAPATSPPSSSSREVMALALGEKASRLAVTYGNSTLAVWPLEPTVGPTFSVPDLLATHVVMRPADGPLAVARALNGTATVLDGSTGETRGAYTSQGPGELFRQVAYAWGGRRLLYSDGPATYVLDPTGCVETSGAAEGDERCRLPDLVRMPHQQTWLLGSPLTPDGLRFATGDGDGIVRVWAADTLALLAAYETNGGKLVSVAFTPDGNHLVAFDAKGRAHVWKTQLETRSPAAVEADVDARSSWRLVGRKLERKDGR